MRAELLPSSFQTHIKNCRIVSDLSKECFSCLASSVSEILWDFQLSSSLLLLRAVLNTREPLWTASSALLRRTQRAKRQACLTSANSLRTASSLCWPLESSTSWGRKGPKPTILPNIFASSTTGLFWSMKKSGQVNDRPGKLSALGQIFREP